MDFHPGTAAAATTDVVDVPAADAAAAVTSEVLAASLFPSASPDPSASTLPPIAAPAAVSATTRWHRIVPRVATGGGGSSSSAAETGIGGSGLPTTVEGISNSSSVGSGAKFDYMIFLYSGAAACTADAVAFPFDTAKTRMQLQGQAIGSAQLSRTYSAQRPYRYFWNCWSRILREEGVLVLYRGLSPALLRQSVYGTIKFGLYPNLKSRFPDLLSHLGFPQDMEKGRESLFVNVCCSMIAGAVSSAVATPFDVLKVRLQSSDASEHVKQESYLPGRFKDIFAREGVRGLYRGAGPTTLRGALVAGAQLSTYDYARASLIRHGAMGDDVWCYAASSLAAAFTACLFSSPFDVVRTRLMNQRRILNGGTAPGAKFEFEPPPQIYRSPSDCFRITLRTEGLPALYKGFFPSLGRMVVWNVVFFQLYEWFKKRGAARNHPT